MPSPLQQLEDLLISPREDLDVEIKPWLNLQNNHDRATLAKAMLALANHGGGFVILGHKELKDKTFVPADDRPPTLTAYNQDDVNRLAEGFADPPFQCQVTYTLKQGSLERFPIISVPGGHRVPVRAKKGGPEGHNLRKDRIYIRRPGPQSEEPQTGAEWDELFRRCVRNNRDDLLDAMRDIMSGRAGREESEPNASEQLTAWVEACLERWKEVTKRFPEDAPPRFPHGHLQIAYAILGDFQRPALASLVEELPRVKVPFTGWPLFLLPGRSDEGPYPIDGLVEANLSASWGGGRAFGDAAHQDFWRVSPTGKAFIIRGLQEDGQDSKGRVPGSVFDLTIPIWRTGEGLLHAERFARTLKAQEADVLYRVVYSGLEGRTITDLSGRKWLHDDRVSRQDTFSNEITVGASKISELLPELVFQLLEPLYALFDFLKLTPSLVQEELRKMREGRH